MKRFVFFGTVIVCLLVNGAFAFNGDMGTGTEPLTDGSAEHPYLIEDFPDFQVITEDSNYWVEGVYIELMCDLDLDPNLPGRIVYPHAPIARYFLGGGSYQEYEGVFEGNGHVIRNIQINGTTNLGLFGRIYETASISNLALDGGSITGSKVTVGGFCGSNDGVITNCSANVLVTGSTETDFLVGGFVASNNGTIINCYSMGDVTGGVMVGGFVGVHKRQGASIQNCYSMGDVTGNVRVGGFAGATNYDYYNIINCYSMGDVTGNESVGGFIGEAGSGESGIYYSYSTGRVTATYGFDSGFGGFCGSGSCSATCLWDTQTSGIEYTGGYSSVGFGFSTAEMQTINTFIDAGWDFVGESVNGDEDVWHLAADGIGYPRLAWQVGGYEWGSGTAGDPYQIRTAEQLDELGRNPDDWDKCFLVVADIDMIGYTYTAAVIAPDTDPEDATFLEESFQGVPFTGVFDGGGHAISNLTIDATGEIIDYLGLFGQVRGVDAEIKNLGLENVHVTGEEDSMCVGGLCGDLNSSKINNCYSNGTVESGDNSICVGGLCGGDWGMAYTASSNCHSSGLVEVGDFSRNIGGLFGGAVHDLSNSSSNSSVLAGYGSQSVGGLRGFNNSSRVSECFASGSVYTNHFSKNVGGLCGENQNGKFVNCYSTGSVATGANSEKIGGLVGSNESGLIETCYSTGSVSAGADSSGVVGLCDFMGTVEIKWCFWNVETDGIDYTYPGLHYRGAFGMTTAEMKKLSTFTDAGWDFVGESVNGDEDVWRLCVDGSGYPRLAWEYSKHGDYVCGDGVGLDDFAYFAGRYGSDVDIEHADLDGDGVVGILDLCVFASHWLE